MCLSESLDHLRFASSGHFNSRYYRSVLGKRPCTAFQGATVAASIQTYRILISGKRPCGPKSRVVFKRPWVLIRDTMVLIPACVPYKALLILLACITTYTKVCPVTLKQLLDTYLFTLVYVANFVLQKEELDPLLELATLKVCM